MANVFSKLAEVSAYMSTIGLKEHGKNDYADFEYFELNDFLPALLVKCNEVGLFNHFNFYEDHAVLTVIDTENPDDRTEFHSPSGKCNLKGCQEMQNVGGVETFQRRYLLTNAYGINSGDLMTKNSSNPAKYPNGEAKKPKAEPNRNENPDYNLKNMWVAMLVKCGYDKNLKSTDEVNVSAVECAKAVLLKEFGIDDVKALPENRYEEFFNFVHKPADPTPEDFEDGWNAQA